MRSHILLVSWLSFFLAAGAASVSAEEAPAAAGRTGGAAADDGKVLVMAIGQALPESGGYVTEFAASLGRALSAAGLESEAVAAEALPLPREVVSRSEASGSRWIIVATCELVGEKLVWRAAAWDGRSGGVVSADSYSSYPGLGALPLIEESANKVVTAMVASMKTASREEPIAWSLTFTSPDEEALVCIGPATEGEDGLPVLAAGAIEVGAIHDGSVTATYLPYRRGQKALITVIKKGFWPLSRVVDIKDDAPVKLPALMPKTIIAWGADYGLGRLLGANGFFRYYLLPDQAFVEADEAAWVAYDFLTGSSPVLHDELRLGISFDPFFLPKARFRMNLGIGISGLFTLVTAKGYPDPFAFDLAIEPVRMSFEWNERDWALILTIRTLYSVGLDGGLLSRGWLSLGGDGAPMYVYLGVMFK